MDIETLMDNANFFINLLIAVGTIAVAVLAIWGDWFRERFASPQLTIRLRDSVGNLTSAKGQGAIYYHLIVENRRRWALAKGVQIVLTAVWRRAADGSFVQENLISELPLTWVNPQFNPVTPNIRDHKHRDFVVVFEHEQRVEPSLYIYPNNFAGFVGPKEAVRYYIEARAENFTSAKPLILQVDWDGTWTRDAQQMKRHLVIKEVKDTPA